MKYLFIILLTFFTNGCITQNTIQNNQKFYTVVNDNKNKPCNSIKLIVPDRPKLDVNSVTQTTDYKVKSVILAKYILELKNYDILFDELVLQYSKSIEKCIN